MLKNDENPRQDPGPSPFWIPPDLKEIKKELNALVWMNARPEVTLKEADDAAIAAWKAISPLCEPKK